MTARPLLIPGLVDAASCRAILAPVPDDGFRPARLAAHGRRNHEHFRTDAVLARHLQSLLARRATVRCVCDDLIELYRYAEGEHVALHADAPRPIARGCLSEATLLIYLNDGFGGGRTLFPTLDWAVMPRAGSAVLFAHGVPHAAESVQSGVKFVARLSVAYPAGPKDSPGTSARQSSNMRR